MNKDTLAYYVAEHEGVKLNKYLDTKNIPTIGIGFNLMRGDARTKITALGLDFDAVLNGTVPITREQAKSLFQTDLDQTLENCKRIFPDFSNLSEARQMALADMTYNLGPTKLAHKFPKFVNHIKKQEWEEAIKEIEHTPWARQVKRKRANWVISAIRAGRFL